MNHNRFLYVLRMALWIALIISLCFLLQQALKDPDGSTSTQAQPFVLTPK